MSEEGLDNSHLAIEEPSRQDNLTQQHDSSEGHFVDARDQTTMDVGAVDDSTTDVAVPQAINEKDEQLANDKTEVPSKCNTTAEEGPKSAASSSSEKSDSQKMTRDPSKSSASNEGDVSMETSIEKSVILPGVTIQEKLQGCLNALRKASDEKIVASGNLLSSHDEIRKFLRHVIKSKGRKGGRLNSIAPLLYICGAPGTGKTISTTQLCNEAVEENENGRQPWEKPPRVCYVNCTGMQGLKKQEVLDKIMTEMNVNSVKRSRTDEDSAFAVILILDEVDTMFGSKGLEEAFEKLAGWARDEETTFSLIGISNSVNNNKTSRMFEFGMVSTCWFFTVSLSCLEADDLFTFFFTLLILV
jgi:Cdc6-like AAA superfamily ATPase